VVSAQDISAAVQSAVAGLQPAEGVSADEIRRLVEQAVAAQARPGASPEEIEAMVQQAVKAAAQPGVTSADLESAIESAVVEAAKEAAREAVAMIPTPVPAATPTPPPPVTKRLETLRVAQIANPVALDCGNTVGVDENDLAKHFAEGMWQVDREGSLNNWLVDDWEMKSVNSWVLNVREGVKFHDPQYGEMQADDIVASIDSCFREGARSITRIPKPLVDRQTTIVDSHTIQLDLPDPGFAGIPNYLFFYGNVHPKEFIDGAGENPGNDPMGTGPYTFTEWSPNVRIVGERFEDYWGPEQAVDRIEWKIIPDAFTRKSEFLTGGLDILAFVIPEWVPEIAANADTRIESTLSARFVFVAFPIRTPPYDDIRVRKALNYAVNKQEMVDTLFRGIGAVAMTGITHQFMAEADLTRVGYPYDPDRARQLLDEARADGVQIGTINLYATNDRYTLDKETGEAVAGYWRELGLDVEYFPESRTQLFPRGMAFEMSDPWQIGNGNVFVRADAAYSLWIQKRQDPRSRGDYYAAGPDEWDGLIDDLGLTTTGSEESIRQSRELDTLVSDYAPWTFLVNYVDIYGISNEIDWKPFPTEMRLFHDLRLRE
jgi:peptide/nickel transport system substrate-binding protein